MFARLRARAAARGDRDGHLSGHLALPRPAAAHACARGGGDGALQRRGAERSRSATTWCCWRASTTRRPTSARPTRPTASTLRRGAPPGGARVPARDPEALPPPRGVSARHRTERLRVAASRSSAVGRPLLPRRRAPFARRHPRVRRSHRRRPPAARRRRLGRGQPLRRADRARPARALLRRRPAPARPRPRGRAAQGGRRRLQATCEDRRHLARRGRNHRAHGSSTTSTGWSRPRCGSEPARPARGARRAVRAGLDDVCSRASAC